jgi:hypothetical protein
VIVVLGLALVASACGLKQEAVACLPAAPAGVGDYTTAFAQRSGPWGGGDVAHTVPMSGGRTLWLFGDTYVDGSRSTIEHASLVMQDGACFNALTTGRVGARGTPIPSSAADSMAWPVGGVFNPENGWVTVLANRLVTTTHGPPGWNFAVVGSDIVSLGFNPDGSGLHTFAKPSPAPQGVPGLQWDSVTTDGDTVYVYGRTSPSAHIVARTTILGIQDGGWEYWTGAGWSPSYADARPMALDVVARATLNVTPVVGGYLAAAKTWDVVSEDVSAWYSTSPTGPWTSLGRVADTPPVRPGWISYDGAIRALPGAGWTVIWSQNALDPSNQDSSLYGPRFARVTNPAVMALVPR